MYNYNIFNNLCYRSFQGVLVHMVAFPQGHNTASHCNAYVDQTHHMNTHHLNCLRPLLRSGPNSNSHFSTFRYYVTKQLGTAVYV